MLINKSNTIVDLNCICIYCRCLIFCFFVVKTISSISRVRSSSPYTVSIIQDNFYEFFGDIFIILKKNSNCLKIDI